jgi:uncharacterized membrane protein YbhN (UPF0104 family)
VKRIAPAVVTIAIVLAMTVYVASQREMLSALSEVQPLEIAILLALSVAGLLAQAQQFRTALTVSDIDIDVVEATGLTAVNTMANYYVPARGGTVVRGSYMVAVHSMTVGAYAVLTVATVGVGLLVAISAGLISSAFLAVQGEGDGLRLVTPFLGALGLLAAAIVAALASVKLFSRTNRFASAVDQVKSAVALWRHERSAGLRLLFWTILVLAAQASRLFVAFSAVGVNIAPAEMVLIGSLVSMSFVISITPGNLGVKEGITAFAAALVGVPANVALLAALVDRGAALLITFGVGVSFLGPLMRRAKASRSGSRE